jgi:hypothetical protein
MKINPEEIDHIEEAGELDGKPVKLIRTKGGFWIATGRPMGRMMDQALSAGSHPAIVKYNVEKMYGNFRPSLMKSVLFNENPLVEKHSHFLSDDLRKSGHDLYSVETNGKIEFQLTFQNVKIAGAKALVKSEEIEIFELLKRNDMESEHLTALAAAVAEKALMLGLKVKIKS